MNLIISRKGCDLMKGIRKRIFSLIIVMAMAVGFAGLIPASAAASYSITIKSNEKYSMAYDVLRLVNKERKARGYSELVMDKNLLASAMLRASEQRISTGHIRPDGTDCFTAFDWTSSAGENVAYGYTTAKDVMNGWMNSSGHRANILGGYTKIGIGCVYVDGTYYWAQLFSGGTAARLTQPSDKTLTLSTKISGDFKSKYIPNSTPAVSKITSTSKSATLSWSRVTKANGYRVYKYDAASDSYKKLATISSPTTTSYTDKSVKPGETPKYKIRAYRKVGAVTGWTAYSASKSKSISPAKVAITGKSAANNAIRLRWMKTDCAGYKVYKLNNSTGKYVCAATVSSSATDKRITGLSRKTTYKFKIRAYYRKSNGSLVYGPYSDVVTVKTT